MCIKRHPPVNETVEPVQRLRKILLENERGQAGKNQFALFVALHGHFSNHFIPDLNRLANLLTA
jgi:hypothetical protein